jgi:hypothetical protein
MLVRKTRTAIIALIASAGFAVASAAPAVSHAQWFHYCLAGHCTTAPNAPSALAPKSAVGGGKGPCEANKAAFEGPKVPTDPGLPTNGPVIDTNEGLGGKPIVEAESPEKKEETARQKEHEKDEDEARAAEAERAAFESGCSSAGLHSK